LIAIEIQSPGGERRGEGRGFALRRKKKEEKKGVTSSAPRRGPTGKGV